MENIEQEMGLSPEQEQHFVDLIQFLIGSHNALVQSVKGQTENEEDFVVDVVQFDAVLTSLSTTAKNFADLIGLDIESSPANEAHEDGCGCGAHGET